MKQILYIIIALILPLGLAAQSSDQNYVLTRTYQKLDGTTYLDKIQYFDGLGRPVETVLKGHTSKDNGATWVDLVNLTEYDLMGRVNRQWLAAPATNNSGAYADPNSFFINASPKSCFGNDTKPYSETMYEPSSVNRVSAKKGAGAAWDQHPVSSTYDINGSDVACYYVNANNQLYRGQNYASGSLFKTTVTDEDGKTTDEYKDKMDRVVMKQDSSNVKTCFVYNDLGELSYVLPPLACDNLSAINTAYADDNDYLKKYAYLYQYDTKRGNNIMKRLPGCDPVYMVYDKTDRLILSQDGNQRLKKQQNKKQWMVSKYDTLGRVIFKGLVYLDSLKTVQNLNDDYHSQLIAENYVTGSGYTNNNFTDAIPLTQNYYDTYDFINLLSVPADKTKLPFTTFNGYDAQYTSSQGLLTGTRTYILDKVINSYLTSALYYDDRGRLVQSRSTNHLGGYDIVYNHFDFTGRVLTSRKEHNTSTQSMLYEVYNNTYDNVGRPLTTTYQYNSPNPFTLTTEKYDELGRLTTMLRHNNTDTLTYAYNIRNWATMLKSGGFIEELFYNNFTTTKATPCYNGNIAYSTWMYNLAKRAYTYTYDDLNRLKQADAYQLFGSTFFTLGYNETFVYDKMGNILSLQRKSSNTLIDNLGNYNSNLIPYNGNQIMAVTDYAGSQNLYSTKEYNNRNLITDDFAYDKNGNMTTDLDRKIVTIRYNILNLPDTIQFSTGNQIINRYAADGRKLGTEYFTRVTELAVPLITGQVINQSYLPGTINQNGTAYIDNKEYNTFNGNWTFTVMSRVHNTEGYASYGTSPYTGFIYNRTDHLGNIREVWHASSKTTIQRTQYYASGLPWATTAADNLSTQPYKYNGKEFVEMNGYDTYDYGARGYYPTAGRFMTVDPLAEKNYSISPYAYCSGNPINRIDPDGRREWPINETYKGYKRTHSNNWGEYRSSPKPHYHAGDDMNFKGAGNGDKGAPIVSTHDGIVSSVKTIESGDKNAGGTRITVTSEDGTVSTTYMHFSKTSVKVGESVREGKRLGEMGGSGFGKEDAYDAHLHYELSINGENVNPVGVDGNLIDPQKLITPAANVNLPEVSVEGQGGSGTLPTPTPQLPVAEAKTTEKMSTQQ